VCAATASISGPSIQSVQEAKELLDYTEVKISLPVPLQLPPPVKQSMFDLMTYVTSRLLAFQRTSTCLTCDDATVADIKQSTGCAAARVASALLPFRKRERDPRDEDLTGGDDDDEYVVFVGPRRAVEQATIMLGDKVSDVVVYLVLTNGCLLNIMS
jgi:hypothetical protein